MKGRKGRAVEERERGGESHYQSDKGERKQGSTVVWRGSRPRIEGGGELRDSGPLLRSVLPRPGPARPIARIVVSSGTTSTIIINKTCL